MKLDTLLFSPDHRPFRCGLLIPNSFENLYIIKVIKSINVNEDGELAKMKFCGVDLCCCRNDSVDSYYYIVSSSLVSKKKCSMFSHSSLLDILYTSSSSLNCCFKYFALDKYTEDDEPIIQVFDSGAFVSTDHFNYSFKKDQINEVMGIGVEDFIRADNYYKMFLKLKKKLKKTPSFGQLVNYINENEKKKEKNDEKD